MPSILRLGVVAIIILVEAIGLVIFLEDLSLYQSGVATKEAPSGHRLATVSNSGRGTNDPSRPTAVVDGAVVEEQKQFSRPDANVSTSTSANLSNPKLPFQDNAGVPKNQIIASEAASDQYSETPSASTSAITSRGSNGSHVISWTGVSALSSIIMRCWDGTFLCEEVRAARRQLNNSQLHITAKISVSCQEFYSNGNLGTGNFLAAFYRMRLSALALGNVDIHLTCPDADQVKSQLVLPWLMGNYGGSEHSSQQLAENDPLRNLKSTCSNSPTLMYQRMRYDLRRMAIGLVGLPVKDPSHPAHNWAEEYLWSPINSNNVLDSDRQLPLPQKDDDPPFPAESLELDDATIHFRCGDLMMLDNPGFGFMKFSGYTKYISPEARSIGILTQPFGTEEQGRQHDQGAVKRERCRIVVTSLVDYIRERFPHSRVTIHNGPTETIALAYARMVMANQTIAGISSFSVYPTIGTFGTGYIRRPDFPRAPNHFLVSPRLDQMADNVVLIEEPNRIMCAQINKLWQTAGAIGVLDWFWNDTVTAADRV